MGPAPDLDSTSIPQLMSNGANWVMWKNKIIVMVGAKPRLLRHLEGRRASQIHPVPRSKTTKDEKREYDRLLDEYEDKLDDWRSRDFAVVKQMITNIPDSVYIRIQGLPNAAAMWDTLKSDFEG
ncbi:hypothetical protein EI94DRAFT_1753763 [Lactarius quietus]|nr:hypothetical protein EI94DRAFT_1753763 [Lactarius quietus]